MKKIIAINASPRTGWNTGTLFGLDAKKARHEEVFPKDKEKAFSYGSAMVKQSW